MMSNLEKVILGRILRPVAHIGHAARHLARRFRQMRCHRSVPVLGCLLAEFARIVGIEIRVVMPAGPR